ncbi:MAG: hypothetical protein MZV64_41175 [Ignavibacteriales bacterium]|nr:hypothetical protein [Ignavibacteriales bacterium]
MKNPFDSSKLILTILMMLSIAGCSSVSDIQKYSSPNQTLNSWLNLDTVQAGKFDTGTMWTFDFPPKDHFSQTYNFNSK